MDTSQYLEIFVEESKEHLQLLNEALLDLEKDPEGNSSRINEVFRAAHTLKGMAGTMGYNSMNKLAHKMEDALSGIRDGRIGVSPGLLDTLFECLDALEGYVEAISASGMEGSQDNSALIGKLKAAMEPEGGQGAEGQEDAPREVEASEQEQTAETAEDGARMEQLVPLSDMEQQALKFALKEGGSGYAVTVYLSPGCLLKSARSFIVFRELEKLGQVVKSVPSAQDLEDERFDNDFSLVLASHETSQRIAERIESIAEVAHAAVAPLPEESREAAEEEGGPLVEKPVLDLPEKEARPEGQAGQQHKPPANRTVRVDIERLDVLMNLVSELIIIKNGLEVQDSTSQSFEEQLEYLERITTNLHDAVMKVRMVPIERVFNRFPRLARDLSRQLEKQIELKMEGEETELDRTVIDEIGDPLVHLIRNSADHGLETPEARAAAGKDPTGSIFLKAYQDGNNVVIEAGDDGKGIDLSKVMEKAVQKGLATKAELASMSEADILELLFQPSFSTAEAVSDLSGRGVGLDVVKTGIEALGGSVEVKTESGKGSTFVIRLPLTLAIIQALMVLVGGEKYAIPLSSIQTIEEIWDEDIKLLQNKEVISLRGKVVPIMRLGSRLGVPSAGMDTDRLTVVIVNKGEKVVGLAVDGLIGQQEIVIKTLGRHLSSIKLIAGATILGNGEVALILDVNKLI